MRVLAAQRIRPDGLLRRQVSSSLLRTGASSSRLIARHHELIANLFRLIDPEEDGFRHGLPAHAGGLNLQYPQAAPAKQRSLSEYDIGDPV